MKLPEFLPSGDVLESSHQHFLSLAFLLQVMKRLLAVPVVSVDWAETGLFNFTLVCPAMVVSCMFLCRGTFKNIWSFLCLSRYTLV